jgi:hypothetical protein
MAHIKKALAGAVIAGLGSLGVIVLPADAAPLGVKPGAGPEDVTVTKIVTDAGNQEFEVKATWGHTYTDNAGNYRVTLHSFSISMVGGNPDDEQIDARIRVYSGRPDNSTVKIDDAIADGADDPITYNPRNPLNYPNLSKIKVSGVGIDDDGLAGAKTFEFKQPVIGDGVTVTP